MTIAVLVRILSEGGTPASSPAELRMRGIDASICTTSVRSLDECLFGWLYTNDINVHAAAAVGQRIISICEAQRGARSIVEFGSLANALEAPRRVCLRTT